MTGLQDSVSAGDWIKSVDVRVKFIAMLVFIITATTLQDQTLLVVAITILLGLSLLVGISPGFLAKKLLLLLPFGGIMVLVLPFSIPGEPMMTLHLGLFDLVATREGWEAAALPCLRMIAAYLGMVFLTASTPLGDILHALNHLKFPKIFILLIDFTIRYIAVVLDELNRMQTARKSRAFKPSRNLWHTHTIKTIGSTIAILFMRSYERADRVYLAMLARGYTGVYRCCGHCHRIKKLDLCWGTSMISVAWAIKFFDLGGGLWISQLK